MVLQPTPYSILQESKEAHPLDPTQWRDIFAEIFSGDDLETAKTFVMWAIYHDTGVGNDDLDYWVRCMQMRNHELSAAGWDTRIGAQIDLMDEISNNGPDYTSSSVTSGSVNKRYDPPEVTVSGSSAEDYLADQDKTEFSQETKSGLETETVRAWAEAMPDDLRTWALEFRKLFYWGL